MTLFGAFAGAFALGCYIFAVRPWFLCWGATEAESLGGLPGDGLVSDPKHRDTHAITIHAPVAGVWPWLVQIGQNKGGFYSYAWLENLAGCRIHNADRIIAEYQTLKTGDPVRLHPAASPLTAMIVQPCRAIVLGGGAVAIPGFDGTWGFYVWEVDSDTTRLLTRSRWAWNPLSFLAWVSLPFGACPFRHGAEDAADAQGVHRARELRPRSQRPSEVQGP